MNNLNQYADDFRKHINELAGRNFISNPTNYGVADAKILTDHKDDFSLNPVTPKATIRPLLKQNQVNMCSNRTPAF